MNTALDQRLGDGSGARPKLDHGSRRIRIDVARHGAGKHAPRRADRPDRERLFQPGPDETHFVIETDAFLVGPGRYLQSHGFSQKAEARASGFTRIGTLKSGQVYEELARLPSPSKRSLTREKKLADSGWVSLEESFSNSSSKSRCFLVRFCGVSTTTWTYMSPV